MASQVRARQAPDYSRSNVDVNVTTSPPASASLKKGDASPPASSPQTPTTAPLSPPDSALTRFVLNPIRMLSFLLSLALIDRRNRSYRVQQHTYVSPTFFGRVKQALLSPWQELEPYRDSSSLRAAGDDRNRGSRRDEESWTWKKKHRKMMRLEVRDALIIRKRVVFVLILAGILVGTFTVMAVKTIWGWFP